MDIEKQEAKNIFNVAGNLNVTGGSLTFNALYIDGSPANPELLSADSRLALYSAYQFSYLEVIKTELQQKPLITRAFAGTLLERLEQPGDIPLVGSPGAGKTCLLYQLSGGITDLVYLSLKDKSPASVTAYLVNKIHLARGLPLIRPADTDLTLQLLQSLLASGEMTFLLDDCEANPEALKHLLGLAKFKHRFIYASRSNTAFAGAGLTVYTVPPFSEQEVRLFLAAYGMAPDVLPFNNLYQSSGGNPLYLYYFSQFQVDPLPKDIDQYHQAIWAARDARQQECLVYCALAHNPLSIQDLSGLLNFSYLTEAVKFTGELSTLVKNNGGGLALFHPAFAEFIMEYLQQQGLKQEYQRKLGDYYLKKGDTAGAAFQLIDIDPQAIDKIGFGLLPELINAGDLAFANNIITVLLGLKRTKLEEGYLNCLLSANYRMQDRNAEAGVLLDKAAALFKQAKNKRWYSFALMNKAISLVEDGRHDEGLAIADSLLVDFEKNDLGMSGPLMVNLSKIYIELHEYDKSARAAKIAYDGFVADKNKFGMVSSLSNLCSALAKIKGYEDVSEKYALKLLELKDDSFPFQIELVLLNVLTSVNRVKRNYQEAETYGRLAVQLCQQYNLGGKTILNLTNYANILRDEGKNDEALKIYNEALLTAGSEGFKKDESRIYWILAGIYLERKEYSEAVRLIDRAIAGAEEINYLYGRAHGYEEKGGILLAAGDKPGAAAAFEKSFHYFEALSDAFSERSKVLKQAVLLYVETGDEPKAYRLLAGSLNPLFAEEAIRTNFSTGATAGQPAVHQFIMQLSVLYLRENSAQNLLDYYLVYLEYCLKNPGAMRPFFAELLYYLAANIQANRFGKTIFAVLLEQSKALIASNDLKKLIGALGACIPGFYARETIHENVFIVKLQASYNLEIIAYKDELISVKLALSLILFLEAAPELIKLSEPVLEPFCKVTIILKSEFEKTLDGRVLPSAGIKGIEVLYLPKPDYKYGELILVQDTFEEAADLIKNPDSKAHMYFLGVTIRGIIDHFHHVKISEDPAFTKEISRKLAFFYGLTEIEETKTINESFHVDLDLLEGIVAS